MWYTVLDLLKEKIKANTQLKENMDRSFTFSALQTKEDAKKNVVWRGLCEVAKIFAPLF